MKMRKAWRFTNSEGDSFVMTEHELIQLRRRPNIKLQWLKHWTKSRIFVLTKES